MSKHRTMRDYAHSFISFREDDLQSLRGSTTLVTVMMLLCMLSLVSLVCVYALAVALRHQAETAADFSALAGAQKIFTAPELACKVAEAVAEENGATVENCQLEVPNIYVKVIKFSSVLHFRLETKAYARAGPYESS